MKAADKKRIAGAVQQLCERDSQHKVSHKAGVSVATISQIVNGNHKHIALGMWRKIKVNLRLDWDWVAVETTHSRFIKSLLAAAQERSMSLCFSHDAGAGKSQAFRSYEREVCEVVYVECRSYWTRKQFMKELLRAGGMKDGGTFETLIARWIDGMKELDRPLVILDQADKLKDSQFALFHDFYDQLDGHCGFVLSGVPALEVRIERGCRLDRVGYREIRSRIGRKYIKLEGITPEDVGAICRANGVEDAGFIDEAYHVCGGDLRVVKRRVQAYRLDVKKAA